MDLYMNVRGQHLQFASGHRTLVEGSQEFVHFNFQLSDDWDGLSVFAQFIQDGTAYNKYLDEDNRCTLPAEIKAGTCTLILGGNGGKVIATTNYLLLTIDSNMVVSNSESTEISESLYQQLITKLNALGSVNGQSILDLIDKDADLQAQINLKAAQKDLTTEINRAKAAEKANSDAITKKASQSEVDAMKLQLDRLANNEVIASQITDSVQQELNKYLTSGQLAAMTINDGSIGRSKVDSNFEETLKKADSAMQPSVYDPQNMRVDVYSYAQAHAAIVQGNVDTLKSEIRDAYELTDTLKYQNLKDTIQGAVALSRTYSQALLADYKAFTIKIVEDLPNVGDAQTFYLVPKDNGNGYDKFWFISDANGNGVWDVFGGSSTVVVDALPATGEEDVDYILKTSSGCLYYKYIEGRWRIVAGSIAYVAATLPDVSEGNSFTDYYVVQNETGSYIHYRFVNGEYHVIGGDSYTKDEINAMLSTMNENIATNATNISKNEAEITANKTNIESLSRTIERVDTDVKNIDTEGFSYYHTIEKNEDTGNYVFTLFQVKGSTEEIASQTVLPATGGGGGDTPSATTTITLDRITQSPMIVTVTDRVVIDVDFSAVDMDGESVDATFTWKSGSNILFTGTMVQGRNSFDLTDYVSIGSQKLSLTVVDEAGSLVLKSWTVQKVDVRIESAFNDRYTTQIGRNVSFTYTPYGAVAKTIHFKLDGVETTTSTSSSGTLQSYSIPAQPHGSHLLEVWATAVINNIEVETTHIYKDIIWYDESLDEDGEYRPAVVGCIYRSDYYGVLNVRQYDTVPIVCNVFDPKTNYPIVQRYLDGELVGTETLSSTQTVWNFKSDDIGEHALRIVVRDTVVDIQVNVTELGIDVSPITTGLEIDFNPTGTTNSSTNRVWKNDKYSMSVSSNFDWSNGGYKTDSNGDTYFLVKAGTRVSFDYYMFPSDVKYNPATLGSEMKIIFMTENVQDANAVWFTNVDSNTTEIDGVSQTTNIGIQLGVHEGWLKTNGASNTDVQIGEGGDAETVSATNTYLYMPYSEEDIIEMDINIDAIDQEDSSAQAFAMAYEDGVPSKAFVYNQSEHFYQRNQKPITIGSDYCDVRIYRLKVYSTALTTENIMRNFIADSRDSTTMLNRYDRNSIYYNRETGTYTPYSSEGELDPERLAPVVPNVKILLLETDQFTTSKSTFVKASLRCIHAEGGTVYPGDPYLDNWYFENGYHSGQGTTSDNYGNAGRNVDFLFNSDGVHKPSDKVNAEPGYISKVTLGYNTENAHTESVTDWMGDEGKVALTRTSVPNNFFNLKVNIASSENVNNALLQKRYNDYLPYISPAKRRDPNVKNDMEFVPAILFIRETNPDVSTHKEFLDDKWHFYALGNIGDSKKTDYTRAYDPDDMNEFTIEISDNTKNNATFQTGVYMDGDRRVVETIGDNGIHSYVYPITEQEWSESNNRRNMLYTEGFDGKHSFEPRYACCGDYRDGKIVNDTHGGIDKAQIEKNNEVWRAFYRWVVTATDEQFVDELDQWCVRSAVEFFYAFTHMYTMMDNRAKNTFWHFAKTGEHIPVSRPVPELLHVYSELKEGTEDEYVTTTDTSIVPGKTYYTEYAFDLWDYDNDTALGINNNGELVFPYGKEDSDFNIDNTPSSGYVYNGATSVFWCRLRDLLQDEIVKTFNTQMSAECFSASSLINQFDSFQECFPEEIWRLDIQRKYIRTFTGESIDNSKEKHDIQYLRDMMQGRKKYQRRQWVRDQEMYFGTMNLMNSVVGDDNRITFRCFTPTGDDVVVPPDYTLRIVPYSDMYLSVMFGNGGTTERIRAKGGVEYTIDCPLSTMDDTQVTIYGANRIQALSDLSACYIAANNFSMATKLRKLVLGNTTPGYNNAKLVSLTIGNNDLLEELDIRNCGSLTGTVDLSRSSNLLRLYAEGTRLTGVVFATNGKLQIAHLPNTINTLTMRNLNNLVDFDADLGRIATLTLQGGTLDNLAIITECVDTLETLYLYDIDWTVPDTELLNAMLNLFYSLVTGSVYVAGPIRNQELISYKVKWPDAEVTYNPQQMVEQHLITYVNDDADNTVLLELYVDQGAQPPDIWANGMLKVMPTKASDEQYNYSFGEFRNGEYVVGSGWDNITEGVRFPRTVKAAYTKTIRTYTVNWYAREGVRIATKQALYGEDVTYEGNIPENDSQEGAYIFNLFAGWDKSTGCIRGDTNVYAKWESATIPQSGKDLSEMTPAEIYAVAKSGRVNGYFHDRDFVDIEWGNDFDFTNVESRLLVKDKYFDGNSYLDTDLSLFGENERSFTIAIDFKFANTSNTNTLVSCYDEDGTEGFRLYFNGVPTVQWGDKTIQVGSYGVSSNKNKHYRDIVVLRHKKGENTLKVYHTKPVSNDIFSDYIQGVEITRTRATKTDARLSFGAVRFSDGGHDYYGTGCVNWCKIWFDDIGENACVDLASWCHETVRFEFIGPESNPARYRLAGATSQRCNASFMAINAFNGRNYQHNKANTNVGGWDKSEARMFMNGRVYRATPIQWKAMMKKVRIQASAGGMSSEILTSEDFIYTPCVKEIFPADTNPVYNNEGIPIEWFVNGSYPNTVGKASTAAALIQRFRGLVIHEDAVYLYMTNDPTQSTSNNVRTGDIWVNGNNYCYYYVSKEFIKENSISPAEYTDAYDGGGWIAAMEYLMRSASTSASTTFSYVYRHGGISSGNASGQYSVVPCFSI